MLRSKSSKPFRLPYLNDNPAADKSQKRPKRNSSKQNLKKKTIKKFKKKKKLFSKLTDLVPYNLEEEKRKFYESGCTYNPQFTYKSKKIKLRLEEPQSELLPLAEKVIEKVLSVYGSDSRYFRTYGKRVTIQEMHEKFNEYVESQGLAEVTKIKFMTSNLSNARFIYSKKAGCCTVVIGVPLFFREQGIKDLLNHEIGTHFLRKVNEKKQHWCKNKKKLNLTSPLMFEEGLATLNSRYERADKGSFPPYLFCSALRYMFAYYASKLSFAELYRYISKYFSDPGKCWKECMRVKRGKIDTSLPGGMYKDQIYFQGAVEILKNRKSIDFHLLHAAKINLRDFRRMKHHIERDKIKLPYFLEDLPRYNRALDRIAECNFID